jgi:hypothetical protein
LNVKESIGNPNPQSRTGFPRLGPKRLRLPSRTETQVSVTPSYLASAVYAPSKPARSPLGKRPLRAARSRVTRSRHKRFPPPSTLRSRCPLQLFRFAAPALLTAQLGSPWSRAQCRLASKKICSSNFYSKRTGKARRSTTRRSGFGYGRIKIEVEVVAEVSEEYYPSGKRFYSALTERPLRERAPRAL